MEIKLIKKIGQVTKQVGSLKTYKADPGTFENAAFAAFHSVSKLGEDMMIVPGNSYMSKVYHIAKLTDDVKTFTGPTGQKEVAVGVVKEDGTVWQAVAVL